ncbi:hypothetical protein SAMD00019534_064010 [Acytostelium subglobosum LB1]|uniref:hypothetical protein n=1 Tax=Acytostelium subglobosum LB1 TaxID=1410327 RepID=UPI00064493E4|nr:hypothetical protein SAMD00019534_064010 [Acytostelium subglobosum LB1]GAM23226.1 hypothetical protein SAMD00019534_064010 [Acytostelium subglobosum LB1]|eukprot:XP_012753675.1 hypothetical protein SAMD00019534_064010 [Acytostelium subglobosum LB1]
MKLLHLEEEFNISVETFFTFFFESPGFKQRYHSTRGDTTIEVKLWTPMTDGRYTREIMFCSFISNNPMIKKLVGDKAKVRELQYYTMKDSVLKVTSETYFEGSSIGKSFTSESEWNVTPSTNRSPGCKVVIDVKNNYSGSMFRSALEGWVHDTTEASFKHWLNLVRSQVEEYEQSEMLKRSAPPTPVKPAAPSMGHHVRNNGHGAHHINHRQDKRPVEFYDEDDLDVDVVERHPTTSTTSTTSTTNNQVHQQHHRQNQQQQQMQLYNPQQQQQLQTHDEDEDAEEELSDFSGPPSIHDDDYISDDEEDRSSDEQFFDSNEVWTNNGLAAGNSDIKNYMVALTNELSSMKCVIEVNHTRLLGLETAFSQMQTSRSSALTTPNGQQPQQRQYQHQYNGANEVFTTTTTTTHNATNELNAYITKLEELVKQQQDEELRTQEKQKEWESKVGELENKLRNVNESSRLTLWFNIMALLFFLIGWPIIAKKLWKYLLPLLESLMKK